MDNTKSLDSPLGVCVLPPQPRNFARTVGYPHYIHEIMAHAGICYAPVSVDEMSDSLPGLRLLLTVGDTTLPDSLTDHLRSWVEEGGAWLSIGGVCGMAEMFGVEVEPPAYSVWGGGVSTLGEGYLEADRPSHSVLAHLCISLHYFNGIPVRPAGAEVLAHALDAHQRVTPRATVLEKQVGKGRCILIAPDVTGTVVRIRQGIGVTRDGVSAPDGTAPIADDVLKSGDGDVLDWLFDRQQVEGVPGFRAFLQPIADQWCELLLRTTFYLATTQDVALPVLWLYPRNLPALGHMSHDTDINEPPRAWRLLEVLRSAQIRSTWCTILPGYPSEVMTAISEDGHELAMHYDAMSEGCIWDETAFENQWRQLVDLFNGHLPVTNKNHFLRWEGDTEFFDWCVRRGIQLDQSKGASKTGEAGFNFGSCHPYFPVAPDGRVIDVLELPTPTQDLIVFAPPALIEPLLEAVERHHGVLHVLFHPSHIDKPGVADALLTTVVEARERGMEWWTAEQINGWERARRQARWRRYHRTPGGIGVCLETGEALPGATILYTGEVSGEVKVNGVRQEVETVERWGFRFQAVVIDIQKDGMYTIEIL